MPSAVDDNEDAQSIVFHTHPSLGASLEGRAGFDVVSGLGNAAVVLRPSPFCSSCPQQRQLLPGASLSGHSCILPECDYSLVIQA